jgi:hypothetical protein
LPSAQNSFFSVKIEKSGSREISVGFILEEKLPKLYCGFCEDEMMYYIYAKNAKIYHGSWFFGLIP